MLFRDSYRNNYWYMHKKNLNFENEAYVQKMCKLEILYRTCTDLNIYSGRGSGKGSKGILQ